MLDLIFAKESCDAGRKPLHNSATAVNCDPEIVGQVVETDPEIVGVPDEAQNLSVSQERFAWNASPVQTNAAQGIALYYCCLHSKLCGSDSSHVSAGARTQHYKIIVSQ